VRHKAYAILWAWHFAIKTRSKALNKRLNRGATPFIALPTDAVPPASFSLVTWVQGKDMAGLLRLVGG